jgi:hypothetical protein
MTCTIVNSIRVLGKLIKVTTCIQGCWINYLRNLEFEVWVNRLSHASLPFPVGIDTITKVPSQPIELIGFHGETPERGISIWISAIIGFQATIWITFFGNIMRIG